MEYYSYMQLYGFQSVCTCASFSLFIGMSVYSERFRDNLPGLEEPSVAAIPDCFGGVSINREQDARQRVLAKCRVVGSREGLHAPFSFYNPVMPSILDFRLWMNANPHPDIGQSTPQVPVTFLEVAALNDQKSLQKI